MSFGLVLTILFSRMPFFYFLVLSSELSHMASDPYLMLVFLVECGCLFGFLFLQRMLGSRFFLPKELISDYFGYYQRIKKGSRKLEEECSVCLRKLKEEVEDTEDEDEED